MTSDTTLNALVAMLADRLADAVAERLADRQPAQASRHELLDGPAMAERLGVSLQTLDRMRKSGQVPFVPLGRSIRYCPADVIAALRAAADAAEIGGPTHE